MSSSPTSGTRGREGAFSDESRKVGLVDSLIIRTVEIYCLQVFASSPLPPRAIRATLQTRIHAAPHPESVVQEVGSSSWDSQQPGSGSGGEKPDRVLPKGHQDVVSVDF